MPSLQEELNTERRTHSLSHQEELEKKLKRLRAEMIITEVEVALCKGITIRKDGMRERIIGELLNGPIAIPDLAIKLGITRGNAHASIWRLRKAGIVEVASTEHRGHGTATNIWKLVRYNAR